MSFADAFNTPLPITVGGKEYRLAFLTMDDHAALAREIAHQQKQDALKSLPLDQKQKRSDVATFFDGVSLDLNELAASASTVDGSTRFLRKSLTRAGHAPDEAKAFIDDFGFEAGYLNVARLAMRVSRLFAPTQADAERAYPNAGRASGDGQPDAAGTTASPSTSPPSESPSGETAPASTPAA